MLSNFIFDRKYRLKLIIEKNWIFTGFSLIFAFASVGLPFLENVDSIFMIWGVFYLLKDFTIAIWLKLPRFFILGIMMCLGCIFSELHLFIEFPPFFRTFFLTILEFIIISAAIVLMIRFSKTHPGRK